MISTIREEATKLPNKREKKHVTYSKADILLSVLLPKWVVVEYIIVLL